MYNLEEVQRCVNEARRVTLVQVADAMIVELEEIRARLREEGSPTEGAVKGLLESIVDSASVLHSSHDSRPNDEVPNGREATADA